MMPQDRDKNLLKQIRKYDRESAKIIKRNKLLERDKSGKLRGLLIRDVMRHNNG